ncbi:coiled-coil domain-containing protein 96 [Apus apus]|uniref:coiled-coil domain-containing protein 96 n=1 Tax=Apus apus TaxID=8895 RepID=UPI0021F8C534|nr:coiled-coil domain-containing protein 96 [Apus apus]
MEAAGGPGGPGSQEPVEPGPAVEGGPRLQAAPGPEPCEPEQPRPEEIRKPPGPEEMEEPAAAEMEEPGPEMEEPGPEMEEPGPEEPGLELPGPQGTEELSEPETAAAGAGAEEASGWDGAAGAAPPAAWAERGSAAAAQADPGGAETRGSEAADEAPEESEEEQRERETLLKQLDELEDERERLQQASTRLQLRLGGLLRQRKGEGSRRAAASADGKQLYNQSLQRLWELREQLAREAAACREREAVWRRKADERQARARAEWVAFQARKKAVTVHSLGRRLGSGAAAALAVDCVQAREEEKEQRVRKVRVENIKLKNEIQNLETIRKAQEEQVESQHAMDLERAKKENQKYSEKIGDLSDEILKLQKKVSNTVHILSQLREKLQFVEAENQGRKAELMEMETVLSQKRDVLAKTKQARDRLWRNNLKLQQKSGLLGNKILLRDFEETMDTAELLSQQLETLKHHHAGLILTCKGIQQKIREANSSLLDEDN